MSDAPAGPANLEAVFRQRRAPACGGSPRTRPVRLTPRSRKACLVHGIDPADLRERDYASFARGGQDPELQTLQYQRYCETREKLYALAAEERAKLAARAPRDAAFDASSADAVSVASKTSTAVSSVGQEREIATMVEKEKRRLEKAATRQQKELMRMLAFESKSKEVL